MVESSGGTTRQYYFSVCKKINKYVHASSLVALLDLFGLPVESNLPYFFCARFSAPSTLKVDGEWFKLLLSGDTLGMGFLIVTVIGAGLIGCSIYFLSPEYRNFCASLDCSSVLASPSTITTQDVSSCPWMFVATQEYFPESDGLHPTISIVMTPSEVDIEYSYLLSSRLSLYHLTVGNGLPLRQHNSLQVSLSCITRGRKRKVKLGAHSCSSAQ